MKKYMKLKALMALVAAFGLATPAYAQNLSTDEIVKLLKGTTIQMEDGKDRKYRITLKPDGTVEAERIGSNQVWDEGKWWTKKKWTVLFRNG